MGTINGVLVERVKKLTLLVQRITELLDDADPLRAELRRTSVAFFSQISLIAKDGLPESPQVVRNTLKQVCSCLKKTSYLPALRGVRVDVLEKSYGLFQEYLPSSDHKNVRKETLVEVKSDSIPAPLNDRQKYILEFAIKHQKFQLKDIAEHFPSFSEKTIRNDLLVLCDHCFISRFGIAPRSYYGVVNGTESVMNGAALDSQHTEVPVFDAVLSRSSS